MKMLSPAKNGRIIRGGLLLTLACAVSISKAEPLAGTAPLNWEGDIASRLVDAADSFLLEKINATTETRNKRTEVPRREVLKALIGFRDNIRVKNPGIWKGEIIQRNDDYTVCPFRLAAPS